MFVKKYKYKIEFYRVLDCLFLFYEFRGVYEFERLLLVDDFIFYIYLVFGYILVFGKWFSIF